MRRLVDLSHAVEESVATYPGLPPHGFQFFAVPAKVKRFGTFPVRAFAIVEE